MKVYRLTYEEIDTEDKFNTDKNNRTTCELTISDYELKVLGDNTKIAIDMTKQKVLEEIINKCFKIKKNKKNVYL